ncbi:hypothetical protein [Psychrobacter pygoscelis]|uniref:hypothetical protein n=1 Tax=Psychrobacter pygoscelis TaxID=2488563 RepID=UPI00103DF361|nr:hypothetical protein [Psychrobacter pygoscelis]
MKFINKQANNVTLVADDNTVYQTNVDAQIRALTVHNPTEANIDLVISLGDKQYVKKTVTPNATEVISQLFNQQIKKTEALTMIGEGLNVLLTVVEITE